MSTFVSEFKTRAAEKTGNLRLRQFIRTALRGYEVNRDKRKGATFFFTLPATPGGNHAFVVRGGPAADGDKIFRRTK